MKSKKFVLAGLVLLAITGLLALAGCKNDSVPETPAAKLVYISVTPPERTVYKVGDEVVHKKGDEIGVTAHYDNGPTRPVTGTITTDTNTLTKSAGVQTVTVRYSEGGIEVSGQFEIRVLPKELTDYTSPNNTGSEWTYVEFGEWPQSEALGVSPTLVDPQPENLFKGKYYSDANGEYVKEGDNYYKVEPIVWRVLTEDYKDPNGNSTGNALLLAESILTGGIPYYHFDWEEGGLGGMRWSGPRIIGDKTIHPNNYEHSQIRAWLNGLSYQSKESEGATQSPKDEYKNAGFLQTAFTESAQKLIELTSVDNSAASTIPSGITDEDLESDWNSGENQYASDTPTKDKIFLLSRQEATESEYGFDVYNNLDIARVRDTTDYAKATGVYQWDSSAGWWLRSPYYGNERYAQAVDPLGNADDGIVSDVYSAYVGVVPALSISLTEN